LGFCHLSFIPSFIHDHSLSRIALLGPSASLMLYGIN